VRVCAIAFPTALILALIAVGGLLATTPRALDAPRRVAELARIHAIPMPPQTPPPRFVTALIATEDHRFYSVLDPGVDPIAAARAALEWVLGRRGDLGGSTIEQQLAKMLYTPSERGWGVKLEQVAIGVKMRFRYSKDQILAMYAEVVYFGDGYWGLRNASCGYFERTSADLSWGQAAMLAGVLNGPSIFDPRTHPAAARRRQGHVFDRLVAVGALTRDQADQALAEPLGLAGGRCAAPAAATCCGGAAPRPSAHD
jgi:penicillin-binding protein 1A